MTNILEKIQAGEDSITEFKSADFRNESLAKEIVAFLNMSGGTVFIGIEDDSTITGVTELKQEDC
ncbi:MAG: ATP-binding protein [Candidatus Riflebacteria bacterium]|nr:ATP-binding protein [Candidatus Riflebacteria bacterium]